MPSTSSEHYMGNPLAVPIAIKCDVDYDVNDWPDFGDEVDNLTNSSLGDEHDFIVNSLANIASNLIFFKKNKQIKINNNKKTSICSAIFISA